MTKDHVPMTNDVRPKRPCATFGCAGLVDAGDAYCERCRGKPRPREYDSDRPSAAKRGYGHRWRIYRRWYLARHPLCVRCQAKGRVEPATDVDHIRPIGGPYDPAFWAEENHEALCHACHSRKTAAEDGGFGN
ncbi:MAG: HNH endonuclease signature motif containing protein [Rhodospirillales bacterium]|jgi:5-methylcytosine-specific restriction protein A|nr:HNH endonuclease signature motif containing protein [Rhodospirillales bacterium]